MNTETTPIAQIPGSDPTGKTPRIRYTHDAMIDQLIANPAIKQGELARLFGYSGSWVSTVMASDAFQARLAFRRAELVDPTITMTIEERFKALTSRSLDIMMEKLSGPAPMISDALTLKALELGAKSLGIGGNAPPPSPVQSTDRLDRLADRLTKLLRNTNGEIQDVEAREVGEQPRIEG
jgi:hypothetical protein